MNKTTELTTVDQIREAIKEFEKTQKKYREYGAGDTEPDGIFQQILLNAVAGREPKIPRTGNGWDLYASSMDCEPAAAALHDNALKIVNLIENCRVRELTSIKQLVKDYCWRFN